MPKTLKRANVKVKVNGQFQDLGLLQSDVATQLASEIATRQSNDNSLEANKIPYPLNPNSKYGNPGDVLRTDGAGGTKWVPVGLPTDEQTQDAINNWLDAHPEATTTVQDGSLTEAKFTDESKLKTVKDYVTPQMFGAKADGTTDDSTPIINAIDYAVQNKCILFFPSGTYAIYENKIFQNASFVGIKLGLVIKGSGKHNSVLKLMGNDDIWFFDSTNNEKYNRISFEDIGFIAENPSKGNGFYLYSTGQEKQLSFTDCYFELSTVLVTDGTGNADLNRFINCLFVTYNTAFISKNPQSVDNEFIACKGLIYKDLCEVYDGGNFKFIGGDFDLYPFENDVLYSYVVKYTGLNTSIGNGDITFYGVRFEFHGNKGFFDGAEHKRINVLFDRCSLARQPENTITVVNLKDNNILTFSKCVFPANINFNVNASFSSGETFVGAILKFIECSSSVLNLRDLITVNGNSYTISADGCYAGNGGQARKAALDFYITTSLSLYTSGNIKHNVLKPTGQIFPLGTSSGSDIYCVLPKDAYISKIYLFKPAELTAANANVAYYFGNEDKTITIAQTETKSYREDLKYTLEDFGVLPANFGRLHIWAVSDTTVGISKGIIYIEYV